jgi:hypothetical protein
LLKSGITGGHALEIGYGPGYLGLEWLSRCPQGRLTGLDISPDMQALAGRNALGTAAWIGRTTAWAAGISCLSRMAVSMQFFTNGSLHEWSILWKPSRDLACAQTRRPLLIISDLRRDMNFLLYTFYGWAHQRGHPAGF